MSECSGDFYQSHGYFINSAYRGVQLICKLQRLMLSPKRMSASKFFALGLYFRVKFKAAIAASHLCSCIVPFRCGRNKDLGKWVVCLY